MATINTIKDLAGILREQPTGTEELLDLQGRPNHLVEEPQRFNPAQRETNQLTDQRPNAVEGQPSNPEGGYHEHKTRTGSPALSHIVQGFDGSYVTLNQEAPTDLRLNSTVAQAVQEGEVRHSGR